MREGAADLAKNWPAQSYDRTVARGLAMLSCLFRSKLICSLHKVFLRKFSRSVRPGCPEFSGDPGRTAGRPKWSVQDASDFQAILDGALKNGGDASENGDFQRRKQRLEGTNIFQELSLYIFKF